MSTLTDDRANGLIGAGAAEHFQRALDAFVEVCHQINHQHVGKHYTHAQLDTFEVERGPKYVRVVKTGHGQRCVHAFVRISDGAILYPAGWRGPVTKPSGVRGSIYSEDHGASAVGPWGVKTLR